MLKEEALRYIENLKWLKGYDNTKIGVKSVAEILDEIAEMINDGWFSVKDRMPDSYIHCIGYGRGEYGLLHTGADGWIPAFITHWMPLPEPPEVSE